MVLDWWRWVSPRRQVNLADDLIEDVSWSMVDAEGCAGWRSRGLGVRSHRCCSCG